ncbi:MAG: hypothetical protein Q8R67_09900, partial [Rhodoferax sp.]
MSNLIRPTQQLRLLAFVGLVSAGGVGARTADFGLTLIRAWPLFLDFDPSLAPLFWPLFSLFSHGAKDYQSKIGIALNKRTVTPIGGNAVAKPMLAESFEATTSPANLAVDTTRLAELIDAARAHLELLPGEETMWFADASVPPSANAVNPPAISIYLAANAKAPAKPMQTVNRLGVCMTVEFDRKGFNPTIDAADYMLEFKKSFSFTRNLDGSWRSDTVIKILKEPAHGVLEKSEGKYSDNDYIYTPGPSEDKSGNEFYRGLDHFVMSVSAGGQTVQIHYTVSVVDN